MLKFAALAAIGASQAAADCGGVVNENPLYTGAPELVNTTTNGKRYAVGPDDAPVPLTVLQLYGSSYERGLAYGELMAEDLPVMIAETYKYFEDTIDEYVHLPAALELAAIEEILDFYVEHTSDYWPAYITEEMEGMADGSGVSLDDLQRVNMITEAIRMACSMVLADGPATSDGNLYQLRALDFETDGPFQSYPVAAVHHPTEEGAQVHANFGFAGLVGSITGFSAASVGVTEKVFDAYPMGDDDTPGRPFHFNGEPTAMVLRDFAMFDSTTDEAVARAESVARTNAIWFGIGSSEAGDKFGNKVVSQYTPRYVNAFPADGSLDEFENRTSHESLLYLDKHVQPSSDSCMIELMDMYYGALNLASLVQFIAAIEATGDEQAAVFDFANQQVAIAYADPVGTDPQLMAYQKTWTVLDMAALFKEEQ